MRTSFAVADLGQEEDFEAAREKALKVGAKAFYLEVRRTTDQYSLRRPMY